MEGVPYNVIVFATNGRGRGPNVSQVVYVERDGEYIQVAMWFTGPHMNNFLMYAN